MEILELRSLEKTTLPEVEKKALSACCVQPKNESTCCTPSGSPEENGGECCEQPEDGSACCNK